MKSHIEKLINIPCSLIALSLFALTACGGGDGDVASPPLALAAVTETADPEPEAEPAPNPTSLDDLVVDADNALQASYMLIVDVDKSSQSRGCFSLCDAYTAQSNTYTVNFDSCLFRGPLSE